MRADQFGIAALDSSYSVQAGAEEQVNMDDADSQGIDFSAHPDVVRVIAEAAYLDSGYMLNPAFGTEISLVEPLPHQRIAVYKHMLPQPHLRFLLADDAGAGKTIMTGLYVREMLMRRLISRVLIVPPAGLVGNWEREMHTLFNLPFRIVAGSEARAGNPFVGPDGDLLIVSVDTLTGERMFARLKEQDVAPYDLVIFDEAHKLSADREPDFYLRKTDRYKLAEALAGVQTDDEEWTLPWSCPHLLLLTATPHMGKDFPYYCLWRLLEPDVLSNYDAFNGYPADARQRHFIRRTKEEMVRFDGSNIYPERISDTASYDLKQGEVSEQTLYDETTAYIDKYYNRARILNRSAARLAMSVFQRRLVSSTYALLRSLERRSQRLDVLIDDVTSGRRSVTGLARTLDNIHDVFEETVAGEEGTDDGREENESAEDRALGAVVAVSLIELEEERRQVEALVDLARRVYELGDESKFEKLRGFVGDPAFKGEKLLIFTEHRDTLEFLMMRLEALGFTGQIAHIHGGMPYQERDEQVRSFRTPIADGGAAIMVATDAAGEGINLQFCWRMVNYDIPWNPARLEQRMGRIHRYGQKHDPVLIANLVAGKTREGKVLYTLLQKLEKIHKELHSDKVFDVIGRLFEGLSLRDYMLDSVTDKGAEEAVRRVDGILTEGQVKALEEREKRLYGDGGDIRAALPALAAEMDREVYRRMLPGYVRRFVEKAAPLAGIGIDGDLNGHFAFQPLDPGALDALWPILEAYPPDRRNALTVNRPDDPDVAIFLHPGEPVYERFHDLVVDRFGRQALRGAVFTDPTATKPYLFHLARIGVMRRAEPTLPRLGREEVLETRLVGLKQGATGQVEVCPVEGLFLLKGGDGIPATAIPVAARVDEMCEMARRFAIDHVAQPLVEQRRATLLASLDEHSLFVKRGFNSQEAELLARRSKLKDKAAAGDTHAKGELTRIKKQQQDLDARRAQALEVLRKEPDLIASGEVTFLAHALVVPSIEDADVKQYNAAVEDIAVQFVCAYEEALGATVHDVSKPEGARAANLPDWPGFDLLSIRPDGQQVSIEVKGRASVSDVELTENEWVKACNLGDKYWLYVVFNCAGSYPQLKRVQDPFAKLIARAKGSIVLDDRAIFEAAEADLFTTTQTDMEV